jgi:glyoxylase-like metal-dependent hydrolase (beta-lactamase superfamily II)
MTGNPIWLSRDVLSRSLGSASNRHLSASYNRSPSHEHAAHVFSWFAGPSLKTDRREVISEPTEEKRMYRRRFLSASLALAGSLGGMEEALRPTEAGAEPIGGFPNARRRADADEQGRFQHITPQLGIYRDGVVNVGVIRRNGKVLLIDCGQGSILRAANKLQIGAIDWALFTDHHRDKCSGASRLKDAGVKLAVPAAEARLFRNATKFWRTADNIIDHRYNFRPDLFVLRESVTPNRLIKPEDTFLWEGLEVHAIATPGETNGSLTYIVNLDGKRVAFTGDLIAGPGMVWNFYRLDKALPGMSGGYWGFGGAVPDVLNSLASVLLHEPALLFPSHGVLISDPSGAVDLLRHRLDAVMKNFFTLTTWRISPSHTNSKPWPGVDVPMLKPLPAVNTPPWLHKTKELGTSSYIQADDGSVFLFDCGFPPIANVIDGLIRSGTIKGIDGIWISHYHDDHVTSVNEVRRKHGAKVYAQEQLRDILENPKAYCMPCLFPESIHVDHVVSEGEVVHWKGYKLTGYFFPGQTLYHDGTLIERDGYRTRVFMTGDSFSNWGIDDYCSFNRNFLGRDGDINGYGRCLRLLLELKPDLLMAAHWGPEPVSEEYLRKTLQLLEERRELISPLFPWDDCNFGLDPYWIRTYPYRQKIFRGQMVSLEARIYNHSDRPRSAFAELRTPAGWELGKGGSVVIEPHQEGKIRLTAKASQNPPHHREVIGFAVRFGGQDLGEVCEAIVDYLE